MAHYKLIWQDLFQKNGRPDPDIWRYETGGYGFGNNEAQYYTDRLKNAYVEDGILHIKAYKETYENREYTSAKLITYGQKSFQYGRIEVKAKLPKGHGTWPAIWLLPDSIQRGKPWPLSGEIDLMEHVGKAPDRIHFSLHSQAYNHRLNNQPTFDLTYADVSEKFVEYAMEWDEQSITFFLDQQEIVTFNKKTDDQEEEWPFDQPYYLILNLAIGGWWGGTIDENALPATMQIAYVKVYERVD